MRVNAMMRRLAFACAVMSTATTASAQGSSTAVHGRVGLGVSISDAGEILVAGSDYTVPIIPTILVPIDLWGRFRVEPEVGGYRSSSVFEIGPTPSASQISTSTNSLVRFGVGAFGIAGKDRFTLHYGGRVGYQRYHHSSKSAGPSGSTFESFTYPVIPAWVFAPTIGAEYFLSERLSVGGEVQARFTSWNAVSGRNEDESVSGTSFATRASLVLRFYLPFHR
jgi:hypothetical protein